MIEIFLDEGFKRNIRKTFKNNEDIKNKFKEKLELLKEDPFHPFLKTHKLSGKLKDYMAFRVDYNIRVIFKFIEKNKILLIDIGTHDAIY
jgi:addiction module RelE/StbE family toxin